MLHGAFLLAGLAQGLIPAWDPRLQTRLLGWGWTLRSLSCSHLGAQGDGA